MKTLILSLLFILMAPLAQAEGLGIIDRLSSQFLGAELAPKEPEVPLATTKFNYCSTSAPKLRDVSDNFKSPEALRGLKVDYILVSKDESELYLLSGINIVKKYKVAFGFNKLGHKFRENDGRTPEGIYSIEYKNDKSQYHLSLKVSYPNNTDKKRSQAAGLSPGGAIMIHGFPNDPNKKMAISKIHPMYDWTEGCMAVTDEEIEEIFSLVKTGTSIEVCPLSN